jgi:hypothetical protein
MILLMSTSWIAGISGMNHCTWQINFLKNPWRIKILNYNNSLDNL